MTEGKHNGSGNGNGRKPPRNDDFESLIRDRDEDFEIGFDEPGLRGRGHPRGDYDPYADFESAHAYASSGGRASGFGDRGLVEAITRIIDALVGVAGEALSPEARRQLEKTLRDLLVALRDSLDWMIERIDERAADDDFEIEEIPID